MSTIREKFFQVGKDSYKIKRNMETYEIMMSIFGFKPFKTMLTFKLLCHVDYENSVCLLTFITNQTYKDKLNENFQFERENLNNDSSILRIFIEHYFVFYRIFFVYYIFYLFYYWLIRDTTNPKYIKSGDN